MLLAAASWRLRQAARQSLAAGELDRAVGLADRAQQAQRTPGGDALQLVLSFLRAGGPACGAPV